MNAQDQMAYAKARSQTRKKLRGVYPKRYRRQKYSMTAISDVAHINFNQNCFEEFTDGGGIVSKAIVRYCPLDPSKVYQTRYGNFVFCVDPEGHRYVELSPMGEAIEDGLIFESEDELRAWLEKDIELKFKGEGS